MAKSMEPVVPQSIPQFSKRLRSCSRLSEGWCVASAPHGVYDDMHYIPKLYPKEPADDNISNIHFRRWSTSTPLAHSSMDFVNPNTSLYKHDIMSSLANVCLDNLDTTKDSGRWSMDTLDCEDQMDLPLPRLSLEFKFDQALQDDHDSAYESEYNSQESDLASSCNSLTVASETASVTSVIDRVLKNFMPVEPDRLIGRGMGKEKVDIIGELSLRNMHSVLGHVLDYVDNDDLCSMACVSSLWKNACYSDKKANTRRSSYIKVKQSPLLSQKENIHVTVRRRKSSQKRSLTHASPLGEVQTAAVSDPLQNRINLSPSWEDAANQLYNDESLCKCPRCSSPSRVVPVQERGQCSRCSHDFCTLCLLPFHGSSTCSVTLRNNKKSKTDSSVGTRKSKRNLRRL